MPSPPRPNTSEELWKARITEKQNFPTVGYLCNGNGGDCARRMLSRYLDYWLDNVCVQHSRIYPSWIREGNTYTPYSHLLT